VNTTVWMGIRLTNWLKCILYMAVQMTIVGRLRARKRSHTDAIETTRHLLLLIIDLEGLEHLSLLASFWEERDPS
jgi:hypothetical protein